MEARELYKKKYEAQMHAFGAEVDALKAATEKLSVQARLDIKPHLDAVHAKLDLVKTKLKEVAATTDEKWDEVVKQTDHTWADLKAAAQGAYDAMKPHKKD